MLELVSVVITTYMRPTEIVVRAIDSVLSQTYSNIELIVVDDSPSNYDGREQLRKELEKYKGKIKYVQHEANMGACVARNTGLKVSTGHYVAFLDDDDEWLPEKIEQQISKFDDRDIALVYCGRIVVNDTTGMTFEDESEEHTGYVYEKLIYTNFIGSTSFPLMRKAALIEVGGFDPMMRSAQDYDVWLRLAKKYKVNYVNRPLVKYHIHNGERISTNFQARISGQERLIEKNMEYLHQNPQAWWWRHLRLSLQYSQNKQLRSAVRTWARSCAKQPLKIVTNTNYLVRILYYYFKAKTMR
ncbi:MAG: glycosyltransferase family 2 protein [Clostridia bacterium]|nr:glycosyltransferase family 2 protein [Clostridia bacterium]